MQSRVLMEDFDALVIEMKLDDGEELNEGEMNNLNALNGLL
jgi:hypothetical protein